MQKPPNAPQQPRRGTTSSISVAGRIVCEDEACIGKTDGTAAAPPEPSAEPLEKPKPAATGSISVSGKPACTDEGCIGKQ